MDNILYTEYLAEVINRTIDYTNYLAENLDRNIEYTEYSRHVAKSIRTGFRKKSIKKIFKYDD